MWYVRLKGHKQKICKEYFFPNGIGIENCLVKSEV